MGILLKRFERNPLASCLLINFDFLDLQILHKDLTKYFLFFVKKSFRINIFCFSFTFKTIRSIHYIYLYIIFFKIIFFKL